MTERLSEQIDSGDATVRRAARLLRAGQAAAGDDAGAPGRRRRVRAALGARRPGRLVAPRLVFAAALLALLGSAALAALLLRGRGAAPGPAPAAGPRNGASPTAAAAAPAARLPSAAEGERRPAPAVHPATAAPAAPGHRAPGRRAIARPPGGIAASDLTPAPADEPPAAAALVHAAMGALRRDHDPGRAGVLLADYLRRYPSGALAEEALALSIEAALARRDGSAAALGAEYLCRFPRGRFAELARRAAAAPEPSDD